MSVPTYPAAKEELSKTFSNIYLLLYSYFYSSVRGYEAQGEVVSLPSKTASPRTQP